MGNHKEAAKLVSLHFNSSDHKDCDHKDEEDIATTALKFWPVDQITLAGINVWYMKYYLYTHIDRQVCMHVHSYKYIT